MSGKNENNVSNVKIVSGLILRSLPADVYRKPTERKRE
jgi:hypothetical protein